MRRTLNENPVVQAALIGVLAIVVGLDSGDASPEGSLLGWPLVALAAGLLAVAWAFVPRLGGGRA